MWINKVIFAILIAVSAVFYVLYIWDFALVLMICFIALPILMLIMLSIAKRNIKVELITKGNTVSKSEEFPIQLRITNNSFIPVGRAVAHIEYYNLFNNQINTFQLLMPIQPKNSQSITFRLNSKFCGMLDISCVRIDISDPMRIFTAKIGKNIKASISVMPECHEIEGTVLYTDRINEESDNFSESTAGDDPSEVFDLRGYYPGDKLNRIHWKLSSKKDEFIVKDYSLPIDVPAMIFLDLKSYEESKFTLSLFDTLLESLVSISQFLIENERNHSVVFYNEKLNEFSERVISDLDSLSLLVNEIITSIPDNLYCESPELFFAEKDDLSLSSFTFISSVDDSNILSYIDDNVDSELKSAVVVVKSTKHEEKILSEYSQLNVIPVAIGKISASIKDIEL